MPKVGRSDLLVMVETWQVMIAAVQVIDVYLDEKRETERNHIRELAASSDPSINELLRGYVREGMH